MYLYMYTWKCLEINQNETNAEREIQSQTRAAVAGHEW